jgi:hypothetical protein
MMSTKLIRYKTRPDQANENQRLIEAVFTELKARTPEGVRYMVLRLADNSFVHLVESGEEKNPLLALDAFKQFSGGVRDRCQEPPLVNDAVVVGDYRMLERR